MFKASAPGSIMLFGEHSVLYGQPAIACAIDKRMTITLTPRNDHRVIIASDSFGTFETTLENLTPIKPFEFVLGTLQQFSLSQGCTLQIHSEFSPTVGLGSSAAVVAACMACCTAWLQKKRTWTDLILLGRNIIQTIQHTGSGTDIAASVTGGMIAYNMEPLT